MINFNELFDAVVKQAKPNFSDDIYIENDTEPFGDTGLDSLDMLMIGMYFAIIYGINDDIAKTMQPRNLKELYNFVMEHKTQEPASIAEAIGLIK
jgi:acyl carrier protein